MLKKEILQVFFIIHTFKKRKQSSNFLNGCKLKPIIKNVNIFEYILWTIMVAFYITKNSSGTKVQAHILL